MRIALTGNPNSGKTTMYNALTGKSEKVGNWAGVTVDKNEHLIKKRFAKGQQIIAVDLPGAYSMSPFTSEESITSSYIREENPDVIINIVDATNLGRSLFFTTQILELGIPVVIALNKSDINEKNRTKIDTAALSKKLGCPVVNTISTSANGLKSVIYAAIKQVGKPQSAPYTEGEINLSDKEAVLEADRERFEFVNRIVDEIETRRIRSNQRNFGDKIDKVLTNKWLGIPIFAVIMWAVFWISQVGVGPFIAEGIELSNGTVIPGLVTLIEWFGEWVGSFMVDSPEILKTVILDGIIGGVGAVVGFLPLVMIMYFLLAMLEDCGYMSRVAVILDPIFKKVGLSGRSVIPFVIGTGCAIPGVMACRTIRDERERRATAMLAPFIPCGAKIPVIALFAGVFFPESAWVSPSMYFMAIIIIFFGALLIKWMSGYKYKKSFFIIEMPDYKLPSLKFALNQMLARGKSYVIKAGTVILLCNSVVTIMANFSWTLSPAPQNESILHDLASPFAILLIPLGFGLWQMAAATITGFIAKEEVVGTLAAVFAISENVIGSNFELMSQGGGEEMFGISAVAGLSYLMFNLFTPPCFAAIGAMNAEIKSKKWFFAGIGLQFATAYVLCFIVYQGGTLITTSQLGNGFFPGLIAVISIILITVILSLRSNARAKREYAKK
ncbi:MAG: ferrous iron transporter B [Clostridia bacterium]|nr:ferrous iron transporter B [Clostridia bacterium]